MKNTQVVRLLVLTTLLFVFSQTAVAQIMDELDWEYPFVTNQHWTENTSSVVADDLYGRTHIVYTDHVDNGIYYSVWTDGAGWETELVRYYYSHYVDENIYVSLDVDEFGYPNIAIAVAYQGHPLEIWDKIPGGGWVVDELPADPEGGFRNPIVRAWTGGSKPDVCVWYLNVENGLYYLVYYHFGPDLVWEEPLLFMEGTQNNEFLAEDFGFDVFYQYACVSYLDDWGFKWKTWDRTYAEFTEGYLGGGLEESGRWSSLSFDDAGRMHIAYSKNMPDEQFTGVKYTTQAEQFGPFLPAVWLFDVTGRHVTDIEIKLDSNSQPHIAFVDSPAQRLSSDSYFTAPSNLNYLNVSRQTHRVAWSGQSGGGVTGLKIGFDLDNDDKPVLSFGNAERVRLARLVPGPSHVPNQYATTERRAYSPHIFSAIYQDPSEVDWVYGGPQYSGGNVDEGSFEDSEGEPHNQGWRCEDKSGNGVGAYGKVWSNLDIAWPPIRAWERNDTPRWGFVDDGVVVPGTGGSYCTSWCYGPGGYVLNTTGGLAGPGHRLHNEIWSPAIAWPADMAGAALEFDAFIHEPLTGNSPGIGLTWRVRSTASADSLDLENAAWRWRGDALYGGPMETRVVGDMTGLLETGAQWIQVAIGVVQMGDRLGLEGGDATPGPYIDNVGVRAHVWERPATYAEPFNLPQDAFPYIGFIDFEDLGANDVRFDIARSIDLQKASTLGDSLYVEVKVVNVGGSFSVPPRMIYKVDPNPLFDPYRDSGFPLEGIVNLETGASGEGAFTTTDSLSLWRIDLPDEGFLYPGDQLHFYIEAVDNLGGVATIPEDTTGYSLFPGNPQYEPFVYPPEFAFRALPTLHSANPGDQPSILFWYDAEGSSGMDEWSTALRNLGLVEGVDFDFYSTNAPSSGLGNGLSRATAKQLMYETIIYTSGHQPQHTLATMEAGNPGGDLSVLDDWLREGGKNLLIFGDNLASDLASSMTSGPDFLEQWVGLTVHSRDAHPNIQAQRRPNVVPMAGNTILTTVPLWYVDAMPMEVLIDEVEATGTTVRLAEFLDFYSGEPGTFSLAAATYRWDEAFDAEVVYFPYTFSSIATASDDGTPPPDPIIASRTLILKDILAYFGHGPGSGQPSDVPEFDIFRVSCFPNPFNPRLEIQYNMPRSGELNVDIFDLQGRRVRGFTEVVQSPGEGRFVWNGTDAQGREVASGVYFMRASAHGERFIQKVTLVR